MNKNYIYLLLLLCLMLSSCAKIQSSKSVAFMSSDFEHHWFGVGFRVDNTLRWRMNVDLRDGMKRIDYLGVSCHSQLIFQGAEEGKLFFLQAFEAGSDRCKEMVRVVLEPVGTQTMRYTSYGFLGNKLAIGILVL